MEFVILFDFNPFPKFDDSCYVFICTSSLTTGPSGVTGRWRDGTAPAHSLGSRSLGI